MSNVIKELTDKKLINPPPWLPLNVQYLGITGSVAYGVSSDTSDMDLIGWAIPPKNIIFPPGEIVGFGKHKNRFDQFLADHIEDKDALGGKGRNFDITVYNIVRFFHLCLDNNPNLIDVLFLPQTCILHITQIGNLVRENRHIFLHRGCFPRFKGYSYQMMHKMKSKNPVGKRKEIIEKFGFDTKYAYHLVRLLQECEQILATGDLDLQQNNEHLKAIRRGEVSEDDIMSWASDKEKHLEKLYNESKLPWGPNEEKVKELLVKCLEIQYSSLKDCIVMPEIPKKALQEISEIIEKYKEFIY